MTSRSRGKRAEVGRRKAEVIHRRRAGRQMAARSVVCGHNEAGRRQRKHCNSHQWPLERPVGPSASLWRRAAWACMNNIVLLDGLGVVTRPGMHTGHFGVLGGCCGSSVRPGGSEMSTSSTLDRKRGLYVLHTRSVCIYISSTAQDPFTPATNTACCISAAHSMAVVHAKQSSR